MTDKERIAKLRLALQVALAELERRKDWIKGQFNSVYLDTAILTAHKALHETDESLFPADNPSGTLIQNLHLSPELNPYRIPDSADKV